MNVGAFNEAGFNSRGFTDPDLTYSPDQSYILHLESDSGTFLRKVEGFLLGGTWDTQVNTPGTLTFSIPLDSALAQTGELKNPNRIILRASESQILQRFIITKTSADTIKSTLKVECQGLLYLLGQSLAPLQGIFGGSINLKTQITTLLGYQKNANPITMGFMHPRYAEQEHIMGLHSDKSILDAIMQAWSQYGGVIGIDPGGRFSWDTSSLAYAPYPLTLYDDIETYTYEEDSSQIINRIYAKGNITKADGETANRPRIVLDLIGNEHIDDLASQAIYGIRESRMSFNTEDATELSLMANRTLEYTANPVISRKISAIDLSRIHLDPDNPIVPHAEYIFVGAKVRVEPPSNVPNDSTFSAMVLSCRRSLSDPLKASIMIGISPMLGMDGGDNKGRVIRGSDTEFFDDLVNTFDTNTGYVETLFDQDEAIWDYLENNLDNIELPEISTSVNDIKPVAKANALGSLETFAPADHEHEGLVKDFDAADTAITDLANLQGFGFGWLDAGAGTNEGLYVYPPNGSLQTDWTNIARLVLSFNASWTQKSDLGTPNSFRIGYLDSGAGTDAGFWLFPPDGTTNADWIPLPSYN